MLVMQAPEKKPSTHQRILRGETVAAARGRQPLRATATAATMTAGLEQRDDALKAARGLK